MDDFIPSQQTLVTNSNNLSIVPVSERNIRAAFWCATWDDNNNNPILGKAIYTDRASFRFQHWTHVTQLQPGSDNSLTPHSRNLLLRECTGCPSATADTTVRTTNSFYFNQFPCRIQLQHNEVVKLPIRPRFTFKRDNIMEFNTSMNLIAADVRTCLRPHTNSSSTNSLTIHYDHGHVALSFNFDSLSTPITKDCRAQLKEIVDALNFNDILDLKRWTDIKDLTNRSQINWDATWGLFNYHISAKKSTTSFKHSTKVVFATKLLMDELPLQDKLVRRRPDLYKSHWKCALCNTEQESWSHLWRCSNLQTRIDSLIITTKEAYLSLLRTYVYM